MGTYASELVMPSPAASRKRLWAGRIISILPSLLMLFGSVPKLAKAPSVVQGFAQYGFSDRLIVPVGIIELACTILYLIPRTAVLGAILITGVLGGAIATNVRVGNPVYIVPLVLGILFWLGLYLRDDSLRNLFRSAAETTPKRSLWTGRIMTVLVILFMLFDAVIHLLKPAPVVNAFAQLGFPLQLSIALGVIELACIILYAVPRTSLLGAILLTGYLGGAIVTQLRVGNPLFSQALFPIYVGVLAWGGLFLRDRRLRALIPLRQTE